MKLEDIADWNTNRNAALGNSIGGYGNERNEAFPEVAELLNARTANMLFNCELLARDEIGLANFIIDKLDIDPHYCPSMVLLQAIRSINSKLALCGNTYPSTGQLKSSCTLDGYTSSGVECRMASSANLA